MWEPGAGWKLLIQSADIWQLSLCVWEERHRKCAKRGWNSWGFTGSKFAPCIGQIKGCLSGFRCCCCPCGRGWDFHICLRHARGGVGGGFSGLHRPSALSSGSAEPTPSSHLCDDINYDLQFRQWLWWMLAWPWTRSVSLTINKVFLHIGEHMHKCIAEGFFPLL